jgi:superfamily II DNA helicase RecQ
MSLHCFYIPARHPEQAQSELNAFLSGHRVLAVQREWLADGAHSGWAFCVEVADAAGPLPAAVKVDGGQRGRAGEVDYKQQLSEAEFAVFARLRTLRKQLAQRDGVPLYAVCSNEQLAALVTGRVESLEAMAAVESLGPARIAKYGAALLAVLTGTGESTGPQAAGVVGT